MGVGYCGCGSIFFIPAIKQWMDRRSNRHWSRGFTFWRRHAGKPESGYISLLAAVIELFEEQKRIYVLQRAKQNRNVGAEVASDSQIVALHIASHIPIYGRFHGGDKGFSDVQMVPKSALETHRFNDDASRLIHLFYESSYYDDLSVKTDEFEAFKFSEQVNQGFYED